MPPATVIYGSEAANGVVVVETKAPVPGKLRFTYNGNYKLEWSDLSVYDLMNAEEKLRVEELAGYYQSMDDMGLQSYYNKIKQECVERGEHVLVGRAGADCFCTSSRTDGRGG